MNTARTPGILHIDSLRVGYPDAPPVVDGWSATLGPGVTLLHGDTGSGKSTLLRAWAGVHPAAGRLTLAGTALDRDPEGYQRHVFFVDPSTDTFDEVTARACTDALTQADAGFDAPRWNALVEGFSLAPHLDKKMHMLSTGSKRKVWLAAALSANRALTLLDEPTGGLDAGSMRCLWRALKDIAATGERAVVVASGEHVDAVPLAATIALPLR